MKLKMFALMVAAASVIGCSDNFSVMVECRRPDGLIAFYGPARSVHFQMTGYRGDPAWVVDSGSGPLLEYTYIPADCTCVATERITK
jgi:hypothetical protein